MTRKIIIENGIARSVTEEIFGEVPLSELDDLLIAYKPTIIPVQPQDTRVAFFDPNTKRGGFIVQKAPRLEVLSVHYDVGDRGMVQADIDRMKDNQDEFTLMFPFLQFLYLYRTDVDGNAGRDGQTINFVIDKAHLYWTRDPIRSVEDKLWPAKLLNVETTARICWGYTHADTTSLSARIDHQVKMFNRTIFNNHLYMRTPAGIGSYDEWEKQSAADPLAYRNWAEWQDTNNVTVLQALELKGAAPLIIDGEADAQLALPEPPRLFTVARAKEWARALDPRLARIVKQAILDELAEPDAAPTPVVR